MGHPVFVVKVYSGLDMHGLAVTELFSSPMKSLMRSQSEWLQCCQSAVGLTASEEFSSGNPDVIERRFNSQLASSFHVLLAAS